MRKEGGMSFYCLSINSLTLPHIDRKSRVFATFGKESFELLQNMAQGLITDEDFASGIEYLVKEGIIII